MPSLDPWESISGRMKKITLYIESLPWIQKLPGSCKKLWSSCYCGRKVWKWADSPEPESAQYRLESRRQGLTIAPAGRNLWAPEDPAELLRCSPSQDDLPSEV